MRSLLLPLAVFAAALFSVPVGAAQPGATEAPIAAFHLEYATSRNGSPLGHTTLDLAPNGDGTWTLESHTRGSEGLAGLLGIEVTETSRFRWNEGMPEAISYRYVQQGIKARTRTIRFDAQGRRIEVDDGKRTYQYPWRPHSIDRNLVSLALAAALADGKKEVTLAVATRRELKPQQYRVDGAEQRRLAGRDWATTRVERRDDDKDTTLWFARAPDWLPVRIEQRDKDTVTLELAALPR